MQADAICLNHIGGGDYAEFARRNFGDVTITHICMLCKKCISISTCVQKCISIDVTVKKYITTNKSTVKYFYNNFSAIVYDK
jgi:hypothetical protein